MLHWEGIGGTLSMDSMDVDVIVVNCLQWKLSHFSQSGAQS